ncbi:hypothetical protein H0Z60_11955 [Ectothiorhodospiraceae bacterium WFHF3C12]|nr:hypothetical protein [Ectothiorhodospiraceae bacterium WFHF3C12]
MMYVAAVVALALAGFFGVAMGILLAFHRKNPPPKIVAWIHGILAIAGIAILTAAVIRSADEGLGRDALIVLALAAVAGLGLVTFHGRGRRLPVPLWVLHALLALGGIGVAMVAAAVNL